MLGFSLVRDTALADIKARVINALMNDGVVKQIEAPPAEIPEKCIWRYRYGKETYTIKKLSTGKFALIEDSTDNWFRTDGNGKWLAACNKKSDCQFRSFNAAKQMLDEIVEFEASSKGIHNLIELAP